MADKAEAVRVVGLTAFRKELARLNETTFAAELKDANRDIAEHVVAKAQSAATTALQQKAAGSLKASRTAAKAQISYGGARYPFSYGAEFGGGARPRTRQFLPHLGRQGYFLYPTIRGSQHEIARLYLAAIDKIVSKAFPN